jgi:hypothetical protein
MLLLVAGFGVAAWLYTLHGPRDGAFLAQLGTLALLLAGIVWPLGRAATGAAHRGREHGFPYWRSFALITLLIWTSRSAELFKVPDPAYFNYTGVREFSAYLGDTWVTQRRRKRTRDAVGRSSVRACAPSLSCRWGRAHGIRRAGDAA